MKGSSRKVPGMPLINGRKDRDEDLLLFKELHKREKDRHASLLQPVSDEFEPSFGGSHALYRIASGRKGSGYEVFGEKDKNDYDWLKTPPATPLFPSLEMEANAPEHVVQREIPIIQPLSRFSDNSEALKRSTVKLKNPNSKPNKIPQRSVTPSQKQRISSSTENKNSKAVAQILNQKMAQFTTDSNKQTNVITNPAKPTTDQKASQTNFLSSNLSKDIKTKPINRGVAASDRSTIPAQILGFSNDTPPNLRTDRATSATRGRPAAANPTASVHKKQDSTPRPRRQSCSPSVTRGRKEIIEGNLTTPKGKTLTGSNGAQIFGSRMVDKVMNARKLGTEEREGKPKQQGATKSANSSANASPSHGFGRMMMMTKSQMDTAFKHMVWSYSIWYGLVLSQATSYFTY
ncbi:unnamed protein product [Dovyalis caffra]|uniref:Uncharacterized protein n=1 Tax=Dovyalis caffra TaxID=77055 RepID=A0AAV1QW50_9ROSI|nr:unnamed protein product [Dovyalis caffra]